MNDRKLPLPLKAEAKASQGRKTAPPKETQAPVTITAPTPHGTHRQVPPEGTRRIKGRTTPGVRKKPGALEAQATTSYADPSRNHHNRNQDWETQGHNRDDKGKRWNSSRRGDSSKSPGGTRMTNRRPTTWSPSGYRERRPQSTRNGSPRGNPTYTKANSTGQANSMCKEYLKLGKCARHNCPYTPCKERRDYQRAAPAVHDDEPKPAAAVFPIAPALLAYEEEANQTAVESHRRNAEKQPNSAGSTPTSLPGHQPKKGSHRYQPDSTPVRYYQHLRRNRDFERNQTVRQRYQTADGFWETVRPRRAL